MYICYSQDRQELGYKTVRDTKLGIDLVVITDSIVPLIKINPLKVKNKTKKVIIILAMVGIFWFSNLESVEAIGLSMPPAAVVKAYPSYQSYQHGYKVKTAKVIPIKRDLIAYKSPTEIMVLMYFSDPRLKSNQQLIKVVKELRGGGWGRREVIIMIGLLILIYAIEAVEKSSMRGGVVVVRNNPN